MQRMTHQCAVGMVLYDVASPARLWLVARLEWLSGEPWATLVAQDGRQRAVPDAAFGVTLLQERPFDPSLGHTGRWVCRWEPEVVSLDETPPTHRSR